MEITHLILYIVEQYLKAVSAYFWSDELLPFGFVGQY